MTKRLYSFDGSNNVLKSGSVDLGIAHGGVYVQIAESDENLSRVEGQHTIWLTHHDALRLANRLAKLVLKHGDIE